jgi:hypothetical protein
MNEENVNRKRSTKGKVATERVQMGRSRGKNRKEKGRATGGIITGVKFGIKEKRQENGEEECMERKVRIVIAIFRRREDEPVTKGTKRR